MSSPASSTFPAEEFWPRLDPARAWDGDWKRFGPEDQQVLIEELAAKAPFPVEITQGAESQEGRPLAVMRFGAKDGRRVLVWARQHGDEPECTGALNTVLDLLFSEPGDPVCQAILETISFVVVPMINPDGAAAFRRWCACGIDLNRDARQQVTPEGALLVRLQKEFAPEFAFNLHDMNPRRTTLAPNPELVALAFQSCPFNQADEDSPRRRQGKAVITRMLEAARTHTPHIAKYAADYMSRGFGDAMMRWGTASILVESGSIRPREGGDQAVVQLHGLALLAGLYAVATGADEEADPSVYDTIPYDAGTFDFDGVLAGGLLLDAETGSAHRADLAWQRDLLDCRTTPDGQFTSEIAHAGDLYAEAAVETLDASGLAVLPGLTGVAPEASPATHDEAAPWLDAGITTLIVSAGPFRQPGEREAFVEDALASPPPLNLACFERVESPGDMVWHHGITPFAGFCCPDASIRASELAKFFELRHPEMAEALARRSPATVLRLDLFLRCGHAPGDFRMLLSLQPHDRDAAHEGDADASTLAHIAEAFVISPDRLFVSATPEMAARIGARVLPATFAVNETPGPVWLSEALQAGGGAPAEERLGALLTGTAAAAALAPDAGSLRRGAAANVAAFPESVMKDAGGAPAVVVLNGIIVRQNGERVSAEHAGRWIFAPSRL